MTVPSYTTDLTTIDDATDETSWAELGDGAWDDSVTGPGNDTENWIADLSGGGTPQGISCTTTKVGVASMMADNGSGIAWTTTDVFLVWVKYDASRAIDSYANGGIRAVAGSGLTAFDSWDIGGSDRSPYPEGGWINIAVDPEHTPDDTVGSPTTSPQYFGVAVKNTAAVGKGYPFVADIIRYGRAALIAEFGQAADYVTFAGMAAADDTVTVRWGLLQRKQTGYLWKGLLSLGTATNPVDMRDATASSISIADTPKCYAGFNAVEVNHSSSNIEWTGHTFKALGTQSPGTWTTNAAATMKFLRVTFEGWGTFSFAGANTASYFQDGFWKLCGEVTAGTTVLDFSGSSFLESTANAATTAGEAAFVWGSTTNPGTGGDLDNTKYSKGANAHHAIAFDNTTASTYTLTGCAFSGFNAANANNDSTFYVAATSGTVTINLSGCTGNFSYKVAAGTATVVINEDQVTLTVTAKDGDALTAIEAALVTLYKATGDSITSIARTGDVATVTQTGHGYATNDYVAIQGCTRPTYAAYNGVHQITYLTADTYTFPVFGSPTTPALGTKTAHLCYIHKATNASGIASESLAYSGDIAVEGRVTKGTRDPRYRPSPLSGTIKTGGFTQTAFMAPD